MPNPCPGYSWGEPENRFGRTAQKGNPMLSKCAKQHVGRSCTVSEAEKVYLFEIDTVTGAKRPTFSGSAGLAPCG
jgi:hypothetical protein